MRQKKKVIGFLLAFMLGCTTLYHNPQPCKASNLGELKELQEAAKEQEAALEAAKAELEEKIGEQNSAFATLSETVATLEDEVAKKQGEIELAAAELEELELISNQQYEDMKLRIQFMYENSEDISVFSLLESDGFADFLNRVSYMNSITSYDRNMLDSYEESLEEIALQKETLISEQEELLTKQEELETKQGDLLSSIAGLEESLSNTDTELSNAQEVTGELATKIAAMEEYERILNEQKAAEAEKNKQLSQQQQSQGNSGAPVSAEVDEVELFAALIYCEAGGESYAGKLAVASVVVNRVNNSNFPNTITGVIYQPYQFSPARSGKLAVVLENGLTTQSCRQAANEALAGNVSGSWLYFCVNNGTVQGDVIDNQVFY